MTNALSGAVAAVYVSDPAAPLTTFSEISLEDQGGDHTSWAAAFGYRYWKEGETFLIERKTHGAGEWIDVTSLATFDHLRGMVTFASGNSDDLVQASGKRVPVRKLDEQLSWNFKPTKDKIEVTSADSGMWKEWLQGHKSWQVTAKKHHVQEQTWRLFNDQTHDRFLTSGGNANSHILFYCEDAGDSGITITQTDPGGDGSLSVAVVDTDVEVTLAYSGGGITSTASQVAAAIEASAACKAIGFRARIADGETGAGIVAALVETALVDGSTASAGPAMIVCFVEDGASKQNFAGWGYLNSLNVDIDIKNAQAEDLTFDGTGKFVWETYSP